MPASEKLKALDADLGIFGSGMHWIDVDGPRAGEAVWKLKSALPQIVAVIESAEDAADAFIDQSAHDRGWPIELKAALKELNDALS